MRVNLGSDRLAVKCWVRDWQCDRLRDGVSSVGYLIPLTSSVRSDFHRLVVVQTSAIQAMGPIQCVCVTAVGYSQVARVRRLALLLMCSLTARRSHGHLLDYR